jgi:class 3 adenylate cyclase/CHASE2 domain-containing sensor protein
LCCSGFFVYVLAVKLKPFKHAPVWIAFGVIAFVCLLRWSEWDPIQRLEHMTCDMRVRQALKFPCPVATNLGFVSIDEASIAAVRNGSLGYRYGLYWPRQVYGRLVEELAAQGAKTVGFDVIFGELRHDHPQVQMMDGTNFMESDQFFALQMRRASNVVIAVTAEVMPPPLFLTNASALADIFTDKDSDGILRRATAFRLYRQWHPVFRQVEADPGYGVDLGQARIEPREVILPRSDGEKPIKVPLDEQGNFDLADFGGEKLPPGMARKAKPFTEERVWHMGIVLAARELNLDLARAQVDLRHGRITLHGPAGLQRIIPVDRQGRFYIDWCLPETHPRLMKQAIKDLLWQDHMRLEGATNGLAAPWRGIIAVVGSSAMGNDLTDRGATPLQSNGLLVSKHWNVANSVITGRFVRPASMGFELLLIVALGALTAFVTWRSRVLVGSALVLALILGYILLSVIVYVKARFWLPLALPVAGAIFLNHVCLLTWQLVFEQKDKRRIKAVLSTIVSPKIARELLRAQQLKLGGARRQITVLFADVRGFTEFTDSSQERVAELVRQNRLTGAAAEGCFDQQAEETLRTINLYLGLVGDTIIRHDGTLDKFIGDCVMAFWGAPAPTAPGSGPNHALACVRAAIDAQRAVHEENRHRAEQNRQLEIENRARISAGLPVKPKLPILFLGTGINTGMATVGLMGSEVKAVVRQGNYTVFGREVNLASRLESLSGRGRIYISAATHDQLRRDDPALASACIALPPVTVKGIRTAVHVYEVPWLPRGAPSLEEEFPTTSISAPKRGELATPAS